MRKIIFFILFHSFVYSQTAFQNFGNVQMHAGANVGFHTNLINDGTFDENLGFTGFYHDTEILTVSGTNRAIFNNLEVGVVNNLELETSMGVTNEFSFLEGKVITPRRNQLDRERVSLDFINHDLYVGEADARHVDGYVTITETADEFVFPVGDDGRFRPMIAPLQNKFIAFQGAYFYEDPNTPNTFSDNFTTNVKEFKLETVSTYEFWDLNGTVSTQITLTWDSLSNINLISPTLSALTVVGWNKDTNQWEDLGNYEMSGDENSGKITSLFFVPDQYEVITLGSTGKTNNNYNISPNGDNFTENLVFEGLEDFPYKELVIFNRWGAKVFFRERYEGDFNGISEAKINLAKDKKLPVGTYFYELKYGKTEKHTEFQKGWVYISR